MAKQIHPLFQEILDNALNVQIERERNKITPPKQRNPWLYMEQHESAEELQELCDGYGRRY
jgi:hypothetical protein